MIYKVVVMGKREEVVGDFQCNEEIRVKDEVKIGPREFLVMKRRFYVVDGKAAKVDLLTSELLF